MSGLEILSSGFIFSYFTPVVIIRRIVISLRAQILASVAPDVTINVVTVGHKDPGKSVLRSKVNRNRVKLNL